MQLVWLRGDERVVLELPEGDTVLGRDRECDVSLLEPSLSKRHVRFERRGTELRVSDAGSKNGTAVDGRPLAPGESLRLFDGDEVQCGKLALRVEGVGPRPGRLEAWLHRAEDVRVRAAAGAAALALVAVFLAWGSPAPPPAVEPTAWLAEATQALEARDWALARQRLRRSMNASEVALDQYAHHRALDALAAHWSRIEPGRTGWAREFDWRRAAGLLERAGRRGQPAAIEAWLVREAAWVARHASAEAALLEGEALGARAREQLAAGQPGPAVATWKQALARIEALDPTTAFAGDGARAALELRGAARAGLVAAARAQLAASDPGWTLAAELAGAALDFSDAAEERDELRRLEEECRRNFRDEQVYTQAIEQLRDQDPSNDGTAIRALEAIDSRSRIHEDARAWLDWVGADRDARRARVAWDQGDARAALALLSRAASVRSVSEEARSDVQARQRVWRQVARAWERAQGLHRDGRTTEAAIALEEVLRLEPSRENWFNRKAGEQLEFFSRQAALTIESRLEMGLVALADRRFDEACHWFARVAADPAFRPTDRARIQVAVVDSKRKLNLVQRARTLSVGDTARYPELVWELRLLSEWLPADDRSLPELKEITARVERYLREAR